MEIKDWRTINGFFSEIEGFLIQKYCLDKRVLEIGSMYGRSACCIADVAFKLVCVDPFGGIVNTDPPNSCLPTFLDSIRGRDNVSYITGLSEDVVPHLAQVFDVVHIDGMHKEPWVSRDIRMGYDVMKEDGVFAIHDYYPEDPTVWPEVREVVNTLFDVSKAERAGQLIILSKSAYKGNVI
jgi:SAM-dependent methyltransferase